MLDEFDVLEWLMTGKPVPFVIDGVEFALRQPTPLEVDRMQYQQTRAHDKALADYRDAPSLEEALYLLTQSYDRLGMTELRDDARRVLDKNYPNSAYLTHGLRGADKPWWQLW